MVCGSNFHNLHLPLLEFRGMFGGMNFYIFLLRCRCFGLPLLLVDVVKSFHVLPSAFLSFGPPSCLYRTGLNLRMLGAVRRCCRSSSARALLLGEMTARTFRKLLFASWRSIDAPVSGSSFLKRQQNAVAVRLLNLLFSTIGNVFGNVDKTKHESLLQSTIGDTIGDPAKLGMWKRKEVLPTPAEVTHFHAIVLKQALLAKYPGTLGGSVIC